MEGKRVIIKAKYNQNQDNNPVKLQQYTILEDNGARFLVLEFKNEYKKRLHEATFTINETLIGGNLEKEHTIKHIDTDKNATFVSHKIKVQSDCKNISFNLVSATFDDVIFSDGNFTKNDKRINSACLKTKTSKGKSSISLLLFSLPIIAVTTLVTYFGVKEYAFSKPTFNIEDYDYRFEDESYVNEDAPIVITKYKGDDKKIKIPSKIKNHDIISIDDNAFMDNGRLESIEFESNISLGDNVFLNCNYLSSIDFEHIEYFGIGAFSGTAITSYTSDNITYIPDQAFKNCKKLKSVNITSEYLNFGNLIFSDCENLTDLKIDSIYQLNNGNSDFLWGCRNLENVYLNTLDNISYGTPMHLKSLAGSNLKKLKNLHVENMAYIPYSFASEMESLETVTIDNMDDPLISDSAFYRCVNLKEINIPAVNKVGDNAFFYTKIEDFDFSQVYDLGNNAFSGTNIRVALLPMCRDIGVGCFSNCSLLKDVELMDTLLDIPTSLFEGCTSLEKIKIPNYASEIGIKAFKRCRNLKEVTINNPSNISYIYERAFDECSLLPSLDLNKFNNLLFVGPFAFNKCSTMEEFDFSNTKINNFEKGIINDCHNIKKILLPDAVTTLPDNFLEGCEKLTEINLNGITEIGTEAFKDCTSLTRINFNDNLQTIKHRAFENCRSLVSLTIPKNTLNIYESIFNHCTSLNYLSIPFIGFDRNKSSSIDYLFLNGQKNSLEEIEITNPKKLDKYAFFGSEKLKTIKIADSLESLSEKTFSGINSLENLTIPFVGENRNINRSITWLFDSKINNGGKLKSITITDATQIGVSAFSYLTSLEEVILNDDIEKIGENAFSSCEGLKSVVLPANLKQIDSRAFAYCKSLESITIPDSVEKLNKYIFENCENLKEVTLPFIGYSIDVNTTLYGIIGPIYKLEKVTVTSATSIADNCFSDFSTISEVVLNDDITTIGQCAFRHCYSLTNIKLPAKLTTIGENCFENCENLVRLELPDSVTSIGSSILNNVTSLEYYKAPFIGCNIKDPSRRMENIFNYYDYNRDYSALTIEITNETKVPNYSFSNLYFAKKIILNEGITEIGDWAFQNCYDLKELNFPSTVKSVGYYALSNCYSLEEVEFNEGLEKLQNPFESNVSLMKLTLPSTLTYFDNRYYSYNAIYEVTNKSKLSLDNIGFISDGISRGYINVRTKDDDPITPIYESEGLTFVKREDKAFLANSSNENKEVIIPDSVTIDGVTYDQIEINSNCFRRDRNIESITFSKAIDNIPRSCFQDAKNLKEVNYKEDCKITNIESEAFRECDSLLEIVIPNSVVSIGSYAFAYDEKLETITLGKSLVSIEDSAFNGCERLYEIYNLSTMNIDNTQANGGVGFNAIVIHKSLEEQGLVKEVINGLEFAAYEDKCILLKCDTKGSYHIKLPESVTINNKEYTSYSINRSAFKNLYLEDLYIPKAVNEIKPYAFYSASIRRIDFAEDSQLECIPEYAFYSNYSLEKIKLPNAIKSIGDFAFKDCSNLSTILLGENLQSIGEGAFDQDEKIYLVINLSSLKIEKGSTDFGGVAKNALVVTNDPNAEIKNTWVDDYSVRIIGESLIVDSVPYLYDSGTLVLPDKFTIEGKEYTEYLLNTGIINYTIKELVISSSVIDIPERFCNRYDFSLGKVTIMPNTHFKSIKRNAFSGCYSLYEIIIPEGIEEIEEYAFSSTNLRRVTLPSTMKKIGYQAFSSCYNLKELVNYSSMKFTKGDMKDGSCLSYYLETISDKTLEELVTEIHDNNMFQVINGEYYYIGRLENSYDGVVLPKGIYDQDNLIKEEYSVLTLNSFRFSGVNKIYIPKQVISLPDDAFKNLYSNLEICYEGTKEEFSKIYSNLETLNNKIRFNVKWEIKDGKVIEVIENA